MNTEQVIEQFDKYIIGNYRREPRVIVRGQGAYMWDLDGREYLDMFPGWAVSGLGHCHPRVVQAIQRQAEQLIHIDNTFYSLPQGRLGQLLSQRSFGGKCFFCNSGAEANEAAIKLARLAGGEGRYKIITMHGSFHGRTYAAMTATGQAKAHAGYQPLVPGFEYVPFNDMEALKAAADDQTAAVMFEPVQGEGGINIASRDYMHQVRQFCDERGILMILDEVQTCMGRTGRWFAYQHYDVEPDIMTLAKALGGGVSIGAMLARDQVAVHLKPGTHASTFGGNPLACAAAIAVVETIEQDNLLANAENMGQYLAEKLRELKSQHAIVKTVRGLGLMQAMELDVDGSELVKLAMEQGLRINCTQQTVIRMLPPMTVTSEQIDKAVEILDQILGAFESRLAQQASGEGSP